MLLLLAYASLSFSSQNIIIFFMDNFPELPKPISTSSSSSSVATANECGFRCEKERERVKKKRRQEALMIRKNTKERGNETRQALRTGRILSGQPKPIAAMARFLSVARSKANLSLAIFQHP
ncbi:hypothetical protein NL676_003840 [Syzygium grande]|nr:hypothetical protein NL676_003840 [Syzygium grande]